MGDLYDNKRKREKESELVSGAETSEPGPPNGPGSMHGVVFARVLCNAGLCAMCHCASTCGVGMSAATGPDRS